METTLLSISLGSWSENLVINPSKSLRSTVPRSWLPVVMKQMSGYHHNVVGEGEEGYQ